ncbi:MAG: EF-P beta-lysylation protein EpmB [Endozoicomonas sp.]
MITRSAPGVQTDSLMITKTASQDSTMDWKKILADSVSSPAELLQLLGLPASLLPGALMADKSFATRVPRTYISRMEYGNPDDPLLRQVLPIREESVISPGFSFDPLAEQTQNPCDGVIHKYQGRLLLVSSNVCAVNCRFCFRRHFPYEENRLTGDNWAKALDYIRSETSIREVILSGGDPLANNDVRLARLVAGLSEIPHLETLRIHTRLPVVIPQRVNSELLNWFCNSRLKPVMVIHCNHANEIDDTVTEAFSRLREAGVTLLNQAVLLKGVNDSVDALTKLSHRLFHADVMPYYLHLLDRVQGAAHFDVSEREALKLMAGVMKQCPGYMVPKLVREEAGKECKSPVIIPE